jgi:hypothetical protein
LAGCSSGLSGEYGGDNCFPYGKLTFKGDGKVYVQGLTGEVLAHYEIDGDKVALTIPGGHGGVLTIKGDSLVSDLMGKKIECKKM